MVVVGVEVVTAGFDVRTRASSIAISCMRRSLHFAVRKGVGLEVGVVLLGSHDGGDGGNGGGGGNVNGWVRSGGVREGGREQWMRSRKAAGCLFSLADVSFQC
jgi:hypothetical protein